MNLETIRAVHGYNAWANGRVLTCCDELTPEQFTTDTGLPWGSIRDQLVHQFIVHKRWLSWADGSLGGKEAYALQAEPEDYPDIAAVRAMEQDVDQQNAAFLESATSGAIERVLRVDEPGDEFAVPVWQVMLHIAHHSMQHRTEVAMALTELGHSPGDVDYIFYFFEQA